MYQHTFVGLDVHAASVVGCALIPETGEMVHEKMDSDRAVVLEWIRRFEPPVKAFRQRYAPAEQSSCGNQIVNGLRNAALHLNDGKAEQACRSLARDADRALDSVPGLIVANWVGGRL